MADSTRGPNLGHLLESGQFSDLTLVCSGKEFNVHKAVVCTQSKILAAAIREPFEESKTGKIVIEEYGTDTVEKMVEFLYTGDYKPQPHQAEETSVDAAPEEDLVQHVLVNSIADYYDIEALAELSKKKLGHASQKVKSKSLLLDAATEALSRTGDTTLHAMLAEATAKNIRHHLQSDELDALVGRFGTEILKRVVAVEDELRLDMQRLNDKIAASESRYLLEKVEHEEVKERLDRIRANFDKCRETLEDTRNCRNQSCEMDFSCYIEQCRH